MLSQKLFKPIFNYWNLVNITNITKLTKFIVLLLNTSIIIFDVKAMSGHVCITIPEVKTVDQPVDHEAKSALGKKVRDAAKNGRVGILQALIDAGADVNSQDCAGNTALHIAAGNGDEACVRVLLAAPAIIVDSKNHHDSTPLHWAITDGHGAAACLQILVDTKKIDVNLKNASGNAPIHLVAERGDVAALITLIDAKADVNLTNGAGYSPLFLVAQKLDDCYLLSSDNPTPDSVKSDKYRKCIEILKSKGAETNLFGLFGQASSGFDEACEDDSEEDYDDDIDEDALVRMRALIIHPDEAPRIRLYSNPVTCIVS